MLFKRLIFALYWVHTAKQNGSGDGLLIAGLQEQAVQQVQERSTFSSLTIAMGFSRSTCLPLAAAFCTHSRCIEVGSGMYTAWTLGSSRTSS